MRQFSGRGVWSAVIAAALLYAMPAPAADLSIGVASASSAMDPHLPGLLRDTTVLSHVFQPLVDLDAAQRPTPALAVSWKPVDPLSWEFELRKGVKWHDGSDFTAEDVKFSIERVPALSAPPGAYTKHISGIEIVGPHTIRFHTAKPYPLMPLDLSNILIVSKRHGGGTSGSDYDSGKAMIGTGPYRFLEWRPGERALLEKHPGYWGGAPTWDKVEIRYLADDAARVAALLAGEVQLIDRVPPGAIASLKQNKEIKLSTAVSDRLIYLQMDTGRDARSPFVTDKSGSPMEKNPLRDPRVRAAISKAVNREAIVSGIMDGQAVPAGQLLPESFFGASKKLGAPKHDPDGAKKLLADAGYPDGFGITLHTSHAHEQMAAMIAEMLNRIGIVTEVTAMPAGLFTTRAAKAEFSLVLAGWSAGSGGLVSSMNALVASFDPKKGTGIANRGRYANPALDAVLEQAMETIDDPAREKLLVEASEIAMQDHALIPILYDLNVWALRSSLNYEARSDGRTLAMGAKPAKG